MSSFDQPTAAGTFPAVHAVRVGKAIPSGYTPPHARRQQRALDVVAELRRKADKLERLILSEISESWPMIPNYLTVTEYEVCRIRFGPSSVGGPCRLASLEDAAASLGLPVGICRIAWLDAVRKLWEAATQPEEHR